MNDPEMQQAKLLDRYWTALRDEPGATPPAGLPPDLAALTRQLESNLRPPDPDPAFAASLGQQLTARPRSTITPTAATLPRLKTARRWWPLVGLAGAAALLVALLFAFMLQTQPQPVNAAELLRKAEATAANAGASGVTSFEKVETSSWHRPEGDGSVTVHGWFKAPNLWRYEVAPGGAMPELLVVADGTTHWIYQPALNKIDQEPGPGAVMPNLGFGGATDIAGALASAGDCYSPTLNGEEQVAGRTAYVVALGAPRCPSTSMPTTNGPLTLWLDKETLFVLKSELRDTAGTHITQSTEVTSIKYNLDLPASLFVFSPPATATQINK